MKLFKFATPFLLMAIGAGGCAAAADWIRRWHEIGGDREAAAYLFRNHRQDSLGSFLCLQVGVGLIIAGFVLFRRWRRPPDSSAGGDGTTISSPIYPQQD
jgi:hypothetical protein